MKAIPSFLMASLPALLMVLSACGGGSTASTSSSSSTPAISGNWQMSLQKSSTAKPETLSGFLVGTANSISGSAVYAGTSCAGIGTVTGTVGGSNVTLTVNPTGLNINLTGTLGSDRASMSGTYILLATGCGKPETGTFTGNLVQPLNGNLSGTLSSGSGSVYPVTGQVSQSQSTGSSAPLAGTLTAGSSGSTCFPSGTTANISGLISGESVVVDIVDTTGDELGQVSGEWPSLDPTATPPITKPSLTGTYKIVSQGPKGTPCAKGDSGTVCLSTDPTACRAPTR